MGGELTLPDGVRLLHVGLPKTGTTSIQGAFHDARPLLREHGVHYAGRARRPKQAGREFLGKDGLARGDRWQALVDDVQGAGDQKVCISNEAFATANDAQAAELVETLGGDAVHVVMVARPFDALLPSSWQQAVRNQWLLETSYDEWLQLVLGEKSDQPQYRKFWRLYDLENQIRRWSAAADPERVTVVVAREGDHDFLPRLFEQLLDLPDGLLKAPKQRTNSSLNLTRSELLRALDAESKSRGWNVHRYQKDLKNKLADDLRLLPRDPDERAIRLPPWAATVVAELNDRQADTLERAQVRVVGDPGSMRPDRREVAADGSAEPVLVPVGVAAGAVAAAADEFLRRERDTKVEVRRLEKQLRRARKRARRAPRRRRGLDDVSGRELAAELRGRLAAKVVGKR